MKRKVGRRLAAVFVAISMLVVVAVSGVAYAALNVNGAKKTVANYSKARGVKIPALKKKPPRGKEVAWVFCTIPVCEANVGKVPISKLGWKYKLYPWDITKGPPAIAAQLDKAIAAKPDYITIAGVFPPATISKQLAAAKKAKIPVVSITGDKGPGISYCAGCTREFTRTGQLQVDTAIADAGKKTAVAFAYDKTIVACNKTVASAKAEAGRQGITLRTVEVSGQQSAAANASAIVNHLRRNTDEKYVLGCVSEFISGLPQALSASGLSKSVKVITFTAHDQDLRFVRGGQMLASVSNEDKMIHWRAADLLARLSIGQKIPASLNDPEGWLRIYTKKNAPSKNTEATNYENTFLKAWRVKK